MSNDQLVHEICVVVSCMTYAGVKPDGPAVYHSCYLDLELARKACKILKHEDEMGGDHWTVYKVMNDTMSYELPPQDQGYALTEEELEED